MALALVLAAVTIVVIFMAFAKIRREQQEQRPLRAFADNQPLLYRLAVEVKSKLWMGWSTKTLAGMEIVVRSGAIGVSMTAKRLGETLGSDWLMLAAETTIEVSRQPSHRIRDRQWIILTSQELGKPVSLAVSAKDHLADIWRALLEAGVTPHSAPPDPE
jgi:hypothetical protein